MSKVSDVNTITYRNRPNTIADGGWGEAHRIRVVSRKHFRNRLNVPFGRWLPEKLNMYTDNLRRQHQEIIAIVTEMQKTIRQNREIDVSIGDKLRKSLVELSGRVTVHLATEDQVIYPKMRKHNDPKVSATAKRFADEMGGIGEVFKNYLSRWRSGVAIAGDSNKFIQETQQIAAALSSRIEREERELYPMID